MVKRERKQLSTGLLAEDPALDVIKLGEAIARIGNALKGLDRESQIRVLNAASILSTGKLANGEEIPRHV